MQSPRARIATALVSALFILFLALAAVSDAAPTAQASSFTLTAAGDFGATSDTDSVLNGIAAAGAQFHLTLGDLSYGSLSPETAWCNYVKGKVGSTFPF